MFRFRLRDAISAVALVAALATGCTSRHVFGPDERAVSGTVSFPDGAAAAGATISSDTGARTFADEAGRFSIRAPRGADVLIRAAERMEPGRAYAQTRTGSVVVKSYDVPHGHPIVLDHITPF